MPCNDWEYGKFNVASIIGQIIPLTNLIRNYSLETINVRYCILPHQTHPLVSSNYRSSFNVSRLAAEVDDEVGSTRFKRKEEEEMEEESQVS